MPREPALSGGEHRRGEAENIYAYSIMHNRAPSRPLNATGRGSYPPGASFRTSASTAGTISPAATVPTRSPRL